MTTLKHAARIVTDTLTRRSRTAADEQLQRIVDICASREVSVRSVATRLKKAGLLQSRRVSVAYPAPAEPLVPCALCQEPLDFHALAYQLEKRWRLVVPRRVNIWWATEKAVSLLGGTACFPKYTTQLEHDLAVTEILVRLHETDPDAASQWVGEDILRREFRSLEPCLAKIPDGALIRDGRPVRFFELGGQYSPERLRRFQEHCRRHRIPFELW